KRVAFASEILTNPPILLCDEPTSGLDSFLAIQLVKVLKKLAATKSMTIVFTIHQPSSQVYELFDRVYMMADGRVAFCGKQDSAERFWSQLGRPLPRNFNPADHYISSLSTKNPERSGHRSSKTKAGFFSIIS
ncbi:White protein, partial [Trichostrongylus colubriformis]